MSISELPELSNSFDKKSSSQIGAGKRYAVSGLSGCGKTTMKRTRRIVMLLCSALIFTLILSACGNSSYNDRNLILSNEDSYTYQKCGHRKYGHFSEKRISRVQRKRHHLDAQCSRRYIYFY